MSQSQGLKDAAAGFEDGGGATSQGCFQKLEQDKETDSPQEPPNRAQPCQHLAFILVLPSLDF